MGTYGERIQKAVARQILAEMGARRLRQTELARMSGVTTSSLSRYLKDDDPRDIPLIVLGDISRALGLPVDELLARAQRRMAANGAEPEGGEGLRAAALELGQDGGDEPEALVV